MNRPWQGQRSVVNGGGTICQRGWQGAMAKLQSKRIFYTEREKSGLQALVESKDLVNAASLDHEEYEERKGVLLGSR